ncbi:hypothetical protein T439DRAFT_245958 [Meredithblackwellia eburnea MCA 4105]
MIEAFLEMESRLIENKNEQLMAIDKENWQTDDEGNKTPLYNAYLEIIQLRDACHKRQLKNDGTFPIWTRQGGSWDEFKSTMKSRLHTWADKHKDDQDTRTKRMLGYCCVALNEWDAKLASFKIELATGGQTLADQKKEYDIVQTYMPDTLKRSERVLREQHQFDITLTTMKQFFKPYEEAHDISPSLRSLGILLQLFLIVEKMGWVSSNGLYNGKSKALKQAAFEVAVASHALASTQSANHQENLRQWEWEEMYTCLRMRMSSRRSRAAFPAFEGRETSEENTFNTWCNIGVEIWKTDHGNVYQYLPVCLKRRALTGQGFYEIYNLLGKQVVADFQDEEKVGDLRQQIEKESEAHIGLAAEGMTLYKTLTGQYGISLFQQDYPRSISGLETSALILEFFLEMIAKAHKLKRDRALKKRSCEEKGEPIPTWLTKTKTDSEHKS